MPSGQLIPLNPTRKYFVYIMKPCLVPPQASMNVWVDMSPANAFCQHFESPVRLTYTHLFIRAAAVALEKQPEVNALWTARGIVPLGDIRIGVPIPVEGGTKTVVIEDPQFKSLSLIASELAELRAESRSERPRSGILIRLPQTIATQAMKFLKNYPPSIFKKSCIFQISNLGQWGLDRTIPAITRSAMLTPGRVGERVVAIDGNLSIRPTVSLTFAYDCRVIDDVQASRFLGRVKALLENPQALS